VRQRNADVAGILEARALFEEREGGALAADGGGVAYVGGGDGSMVMDHEIVFVRLGFHAFVWCEARSWRERLMRTQMNGDMNYRIDQRRDVVIAAAQTGELAGLLMHDQLLKEMRHNRAFRLRTFREGALRFAPTYKYDRRSDAYDSSDKRRTPAWCDRVLWRAREEGRVELLSYRRYEADVSDHRPVSAGFRVRVKSVRGDGRAEAKRAAEGAWVVREAELLRELWAFYVQEQVV
jgi:hypothetical protein